MIPNFFVIGAMKAGTTSLQHYLLDHPEVFMAVPKEPEFFCDEDPSDDAREWYESIFQDVEGQKAIGEASTAYTKFPLYRGVPGRIARLVPDARFIYILREPLARIRSQYLYERRRGAETRPFAQVVRSDPLYVDISRYAMQLEVFLEHFPRERFLILSSDDLDRSREEVMRKVFTFLDVDPTWTSAKLETRFHVTQGERSVRPRVSRLRRNAVYRSLSSVMPTKMKRSLDRRTNFLRAPVVHDGMARMTPRLEHWLRDRLKEDSVRLKELLGDDAPTWES